MRTLLLVPVLALLGAAPPAPEPARLVSPQPSACKPLGSVAQGVNGPEFHKLGELPPGIAFMAVYRTDARGCIDPLLASERQGVRRSR